jgi:hypothetical protein
MDEEQKNQQGETDGTQEPYTFSDENTKEKIRRHLKDPNDVISENDIKNVKIPGQEKPKRTRKRKPIGENKTAAEKKETDGAEGKPETPWDVLDEKS